jgi:hypothetical protein
MSEEVKTVIKGKAFELQLRILVATMLIGAYLHILRFEYGVYIIVFALLAGTVLYPIRFFLKEEKNFLDYVKLVFVPLYCISKVFVLLHFPYTLYLLIAAAIPGIYWFYQEGLFYFIEVKEEEVKYSYTLTSNVLLFTGIGFEMVGYLFKIMRWPGANMILFVGTLILILWILKDYLLFRKYI